MRKYLLFLLCIIIMGGATPAHALEVAATPSQEFLPAAPIMVTGYQTADAAQNLVAVEIYNSGDKPIDLTKWSMNLILKDGTSQPVRTSARHSGLFLPGEHVVYSATDSTTMGLSLARQPATITFIEMRSTDPAVLYRSALAPIKDTTDTPVFRIYTTTGYSTQTQPFLATPVRPFYDDGLYVAPVEPQGLRISEVYPYSSDCAPNDESILCGDYVKLENVGDADVNLDGYALRTDSSSSSSTTANTFTLTGTLKPGQVLSVSRTDGGTRLSLTNSGGYVWLEDAWGLARYDSTMTRYESAGTAEQGWAYALTQDSTWVWSTTPQPNAKNIITLPVVAVSECPDGKYRSPETGRCRTIEEAVNALSICEEGYERNAVTNRCRKVVSTAAGTSLTPCLEGQERNPATNRCRSIASAVAELLPCEEGYERNAETHRCRKLSTNSVPEAAFPVAPLKATGADMAGWWAFGIVLALAFGYGAWEWRAEIAGIMRRILGVFARTK